MKRVKVYWNTRKKMFSVKEPGQPVRHKETVFLLSVYFRVQKAAAWKSVCTGNRSVHAYLSGLLMEDPARIERSLGEIRGWKRQFYREVSAHYRPTRENLNFQETETGKPILSARYVLLTVNGKGKPEMSVFLSHPLGVARG